MGIDQSVLTIGLYFLAAIVFSVRNFKQYESYTYAIITFLLVTSVYLWISCSIFPIQLTSTASSSFVFSRQFSFANGWTVWEYIMQFQQFFSSMWLLAFFLYLWKVQDKKEKTIRIVLPILIIIHVLYNMGLNTLLGEVIKMINFIDILEMVIGFVVGYLCACILSKRYPDIRELKE